MPRDIRQMPRCVLCSWGMKRKSEKGKIMHSRKRTGWLWLLSALWMALIFCMSAMPGDVSGAQSGGLVQLLAACLKPILIIEEGMMHALETLLRKGAHMAEYAVLFLLLRAALGSGGSRRPGLKALLLTLAYAATDEFHQRFVPGRGPSVIDVAIDGCGALIAWGAAAIRQRIFARRTP